MGRIKTTLIKRTAKQLMQKKDSFTSDFETNKKLLNNTMPSKLVRNKIAGYIARLEKAKTEDEPTK